MTHAQQEITDAMNARVEAFRDLRTTADILLPEAMAMEFVEFAFPYALASGDPAIERTSKRLRAVLDGVSPDNHATLLRLAARYRTALQRWEKTLQPR